MEVASSCASLKKVELHDYQAKIEEKISRLIDPTIVTNGAHMPHKFSNKNQRS
jgi:hypothetical protein